MGAYDELDKFQTEEGREIVSAFVAEALADEQQPAEATGGGQVQDGAASEAVIRLERWLSARQANVYEGISSTCVTAEPRDRTTAAYTIAESDLRAVLAERDALAARVAELEAEREADARAVARCQQAKAGPDAVPAMLALDARFADRIAALAGDETDGGAA